MPFCSFASIGHKKMRPALPCSTTLIRIRSASHFKDKKRPTGASERCQPGYCAVILSQESYGQQLDGLDGPY